jgi:hypothetical protein
LVVAELIIQKRFLPKVGAGKDLRVALRQLSDALIAEGFPAMELWAPWHGPHNAIVTVERYPSPAEWEEYNRVASQRPALVSAVFDGLYPTTATAYETDILSVIKNEEVR